MTLVILALTPLLALAGTSIALALGRMDTASSKAYAGEGLPCRHQHVADALQLPLLAGSQQDHILV